MKAEKHTSPTVKCAKCGKQVCGYVQREGGAKLCLDCDALEHPEQ